MAMRLQATGHTLQVANRASGPGAGRRARAAWIGLVRLGGERAVAGSRSRRAAPARPGVGFTDAVSRLLAQPCALSLRPTIHFKTFNFGSLQF
jgi:hypothetical protein